MGESLLEINARHERLIDGLLTLADSSNEPTERSPLDLADVTDNVIDQLTPAARDAGVDIRLAVLPPAPVVGDAVMIERLTQNLVENAIRHNVADGWISVRTASSAIPGRSSGRTRSKCCSSRSAALSGNAPRANVASVWDCRSRVRSAVRIRATSSRRRGRTAGWT
jgi:hypothetical protein